MPARKTPSKTPPSASAPRSRTRQPAAAASSPPAPAPDPAPGFPAAAAAAGRVFQQAADGAAEAFGSQLGSLMKSLQSLQIPAESLQQLQSSYVDSATALWNESLKALPAGPGAALERPEPPAAKIDDRRFAGEDWTRNPTAAWMAQFYLLNARTLLQMADSLQGDEKTRARVRFAVQQWVDAASPANYLAFNPEAQRLALQSGGETIARGLQHLVHDLQQGHVSQTDESRFEVGRNVATTAGQVVFENPLFQLIEYAPLTARVHEKPFLFVPPCINKYYILDLQPDNSLIRHVVEQGHRTFVISWRNADESLAEVGWDAYIEDAVIRAIEVVQEIAGCQGRDESVNVLGFCVGGTMLATALAVLAARGRHPAACLTLLTSFLDFSDTGVLDLFVDEAAVQMREMTIGPDSPARGGLLKGKELASTFSFLRPNDLVWNYVVGNYLKGETPPPFDLLYWNSDSTNLPGPMYCWYLRHTYLQNDLVVPGRLSVCGESVDLGSIRAPAYLYGSREDHIVPWEGAYRSTQVLKGPRRFVLGASGHIAGVINPPAKKKRSHWVREDGRLPASATDWLAGAEERAGSWWPDWTRWLAGHSGRMIAAPAVQGSARHRPIEPAPGRYVKVRV